MNQGTVVADDGPGNQAACYELAGVCCK